MERSLGQASEERRAHNDGVIHYTFRPLVRSISLSLLVFRELGRCFAWRRQVHLVRRDWSGRNFACPPHTPRATESDATLLLDAIECIEPRCVVADLLPVEKDGGLPERQAPLTISQCVFPMTCSRGRLAKLLARSNGGEPCWLIAPIRHRLGQNSVLSKVKIMQIYRVIREKKQRCEVKMFATVTKVIKCSLINPSP